MMDHCSGEYVILVLHSYRPDVGTRELAKDSVISVSWKIHEPVKEEIRVQRDHVEQILDLAVSSKMQLADDPRLLRFGLVDVSGQKKYSIRLADVKSLETNRPETWGAFNAYRDGKQREMEVESARILALINA